MDQIPTSDLTWQQVVLVGIFLVVQYFTTRSTKAQIDEAKTGIKGVKTALTENNGGSSVKDATDRIEDGLKDLADKQEEHNAALVHLDQRLQSVEATQTAQQEPSGLLSYVFSRGS